MQWASPSMIHIVIQTKTVDKAKSVVLLQRPVKNRSTVSTSRGECWSIEQVAFKTACLPLDWRAVFSESQVINITVCVCVQGDSRGQHFDLFLGFWKKILRDPSTNIFIWLCNATHCDQRIHDAIHSKHPHIPPTFSSNQPDTETQLYTASWIKALSKSQRNSSTLCAPAKMTSLTIPCILWDLICSPFTFTPGDINHLITSLSHTLHILCTLFISCNSHDFQTKNARNIEICALVISVCANLVEFLWRGGPCKDTCILFSQRPSYWKHKHNLHTNIILLPSSTSTIKIHTDILLTLPFHICCLSKAPSPALFTQGQIVWGCM